MRCPVCNAWSDVLSTTNEVAGEVRRRRDCANGHRFTTLEMVAVRKGNRVHIADAGEISTLAHKLNKVEAHKPGHV